MKRILLFAAVITAVAACTDPKDALKREVVVLNPAANPHASNSILSDTGTVAETPVATRKSRVRNTVPLTGVHHSANTGGTRSVVKRTDTPVAEESNTTAAIPSTGTDNPVATNTGNTTSTGTDNTGNSTGTDDAATIPVEKEKKGWSGAAKGAVIGGVVGAAGGAIISKKKGKGAIIGAVIGAAGGYVLGRAKDKKDAASTELVNN